MGKYVKYIIMVMLLTLAIIANAQGTTATTPASSNECPERSETVIPTVNEVPDTAAEILGGGLVDTPNDSDGTFRGLGGEDPLRNYLTEELELVTDQNGVIINEPDWGGSDGAFKKSAVRFIAPQGTWFIVELKGRQGENRPTTAFTVPPGGLICWGSQGGHLWAFAGATPEQLVNELGLWFWSLPEDEEIVLLDAELAWLKSEMRRVGSILTLSTNPDDYASPEEDESGG